MGVAGNLGVTIGSEHDGGHLTHGEGLSEQD